MRSRVHARDERGVAMTEFALILPVFVLVIAGILTFGRVMYYWVSANHIANETVRWVVVDRNPYSTTLQVQARNSGGTAEFTDARVCIGYQGSAGVPKAQSALAVGDPVDVLIEKPFSLVPILNAGDITIRGSATMRVERFGGTGGVSPGSYTSSDNLGSYQWSGGRWRCL